MRGIIIEDGLTLRFPGRDAGFAEGVEIGMLATLMALGQEEIRRPVALGTLAQARALARGFGYRLVETGRGEGEARIRLPRRARPALRLVAGG